MKKALSILLCITISLSTAVLFTGCLLKDNRPVGDAQIKTDIKLNDSTFQQHILEIDDVFITERRTAENGSFDMISLVASSSNDEFTYSAQYDMTYGKYQGGWQLDNIQISNYDYIAKYDCPMSVIEDAIRNKTLNHGQATSISVTNREGDLSYQRITCSFSLIRENNAVADFTAEIGCSFLGGYWDATILGFYYADTGKPAIWLFFG